MNIKKGLVVDSSYLIHRTLHVKDLSELSDSKGRKTGAIYQVIRSMMMELENHKGYFPVFCFDNHQALWRLEIYPNYKHNLDRIVQLEEAKSNPVVAMEVAESNEYVENYHRQREVIIQILHALGIPCLFFENWEGDDLMYICSKLIPDSIIMTDDKDLIQLLSPSVKISRPMAREVLIYEDYQKENKDPNMRRFIIEKAITGDVSDNIPSVCKGCGKKAAEEIAKIMVENPDNWKEILANHKLKKIRNFVSEENINSLGDKTPINQFNINMELIDLSKVEITSTIENQIFGELNSIHRPDFFKVAKYFREYEIKEVDVNSLVRIMTELFDSLEK